MRSNGGLIGAKKVPSASVASGLWSVQDVQREVGAGNWFEAGAFESIATTTVGVGGTSSLSFGSIPQTYKHLQLRIMARNSGDYISARATFNSDSSSIYTLHELYGDGISVAAAAQINIAYYPCSLVGGSSGSGVFSAGVTDIFDYTNTNKFKTARTLTGFDRNGATGYVELTSGVWRSTSAITSITIVPNSGSFVQYSHFALYGIKGQS